MKWYAKYIMYIFQASIRNNIAKIVYCVHNCEDRSLFDLCNISFHKRDCFLMNFVIVSACVWKILFLLIGLRVDFYKGGREPFDKKF